MSAPKPLEVDLGDGYTLRRPSVADGAALAAAYDRNRAHLAPWEPVREPEFFTEAEQVTRIAARVEADAEQRSITALVIHEPTGEIVANVNVNDIVFGAFRNGNLGYWADAAHTGRGLMTRAVGAICAYAQDEGLHRMQAATLLHNAASQAVLRRTGFSAIGVAPDYLFIAGAWQDHVLFQRILD